MCWWMGERRCERAGGGRSAAARFAPARPPTPLSSRTAHVGGCTCSGRSKGRCGGCWMKPGKEGGKRAASLARRQAPARAGIRSNPRSGYALFAPHRRQWRAASNRASRPRIAPPPLFSLTAADDRRVDAQGGFIDALLLRLVAVGHGGGGGREAVERGTAARAGAVAPLPPPLPPLDPAMRSSIACATLALAAAASAAAQAPRPRGALAPPAAPASLPPVPGAVSAFGAAPPPPLLCGSEVECRAACEGGDDWTAPGASRPDAAAASAQVRWLARQEGGHDCCIAPGGGAR